MFGDKKNSQILVYIKQEPIDTIVKKTLKHSTDGTRTFVTMTPPKEGEKSAEGGWELDVTGCIRNSIKGPYVEAVYGAPKAIKIDIANKEYTISKWSNDDAKKFFAMNIFKAHFGKVLGDLLAAIKPYLLVAIVIGVVAIAISGYNAYTISKIPHIAVMVTPSPTPPPVIG